MVNITVNLQIQQGIKVVDQCCAHRLNPPFISGQLVGSLVDKGNTLIMIEHNMDVIKTADYIIDLGKEGGVMGGDVLATGTPEKIAKVKGSYTADFLKKELESAKTRIK